MNQQLLLISGKLIRRNNGTKLALAPKSDEPDSKPEPDEPGPEPEPNEPELPDIFENVISTFYWDDRFNMRDFEYTDVIGEFRLENLPENVPYKLYLIDSEDGFVYDMEQITGTENDWEEGCLNYKKMFDVNPNLKKGFHKFYLKITTLDEKQYHIFNTPNPDDVINEFDEIKSSWNGEWFKEWESNGVLRVELPIGIESNEPEEETPENPDIESNTLLIEIVDSEAARNWVETNYNSGTFSYEKVNNTQYKITNTDTNWTDMFAESVHSGSKTYLLKILAAGDTSNVTNMYGIFADCASLTMVSLFDTSNVNNMSNMFGMCKSLIIVPLFDTCNVTNMAAMFFGCTSLTTVPLFNTSNVTYMNLMFNNCTSLTTVPLFDTSHVTNMQSMFDSCSSLTKIPLFDTSNVTLMDRMFDGCTKVESGALALYQQASATGKVTNYVAFTNCGIDTETGLAELNQIPKSWGGLENDTTDKLIIGGKEYRTVKIGNQIWMAQNLDLETDSGSVVSNIRSRNEDFGRLYQWDKAVKVASSIEGWHLPTREEWDELYNFVGKNTTSLKSESFPGWASGNCSDDYGFGALPAGYYDDSYNEPYRVVGTRTYFWTSDENEGDNSKAYTKYIDTGTYMGLGRYDKTIYNPVRLIKDN